MEGDIAVNHPVPPHSVTHAGKKVSDDHEAGANVGIGPDAVPQHRQTRILIEIGPQMVDVRIIDDAQGNKTDGALNTEPARESVLDSTSDSD